MRKIKSFSIVLVVSGMLMFMSGNNLSAEKSENLFSNSGAEIDKNRDGIPDGWRVYDSQKKNPGHYEYEISVEEKHSGEKSAYMKGNRHGYHGGYYHNVTIKPDTKYRYSAWLKTKNIIGGLAGLLRYRAKDSNEAPFWIKGNNVSGTTEWKYYEKVFMSNPGKNPQGVDFIIMTFHGEGEVWIDDIELIELKEEEIY